MRIVYFANGDAGLAILRWLIQRDEDIIGLVLHPPVRARLSVEMRELCVNRNIEIFDGSTLRDPLVIEKLRSLNAQIGISIFFGYILKSSIINLFPNGIINLHISLLPYNRGAYPNVWSIINETPAGVTLHYIDDGVDTGAIISQQEVIVEPIDTGASLYRKLEKAGIHLFVQTWPIIRQGEVTPIPQDPSGIASMHRVKDVEKIDEIDLDRLYTARELINILRARTFPPYKGAYFVIDGKRIGIQIDLTYDDT